MDPQSPPTPLRQPPHPLPTPSTTTGDAEIGSTQNEPLAPVNADTPATTIAAPKTPDQVFAERLLDAQYTDAASAFSFVNSLVDNSNQHNSMNWLDSNGDGKLDASDPAFAAIKLFVDLNNNGRVDDGEMQSPGVSSINFTTGQVNYSNGTSDALTATTLTAETEGSRVDKIKVVGKDGKLEELNAGSVIVHEGYQGLVRVNNKGEIVADDDPAADNRWVQQRTNSYTFNAVRMSDWEGTDKQDEHRHGGKNVEGAPTETSATGATSRGPVLGKENVKTYTTMDVGDKRLVSLTPPADQAERVVFVPGGVRDDRNANTSKLIANYAINTGAEGQFRLRGSVNPGECRAYEWLTKHRRMRNRHTGRAIRREECGLQEKCTRRAMESPR